MQRHPEAAPATKFQSETAFLQQHVHRSRAKNTLTQAPCSSTLAAAFCTSDQVPKRKHATLLVLEVGTPVALLPREKPFNQHIPQTRGPQRLAGLLVALLEKQPFRLPQGIEVTHLEKNWLVVETPVQPAGNMFETS